MAATVRNTDTIGGVTRGHNASNWGSAAYHPVDEIYRLVKRIDKFVTIFNKLRSLSDQSAFFVTERAGALDWEDVGLGCVVLHAIVKRAGRGIMST